MNKKIHEISIDIPEDILKACTEYNKKITDEINYFKSNINIKNYTGMHESADGTKRHYTNGELHRLDGPAIIQSDGIEQYWFCNKPVSKQELFMLKMFL